MALSANATGTPTTNFSIPKFNTASDAPNGKGVNEMMDALDTLIANPASVVTRPASLADHDVPVWNGTTWVRSATRQINNGGQILPVITTSSLAGGPPGSPTDGDFWIATNCDPNNSGCTWLFQYQAAQATYKWVFVGGSSAKVTSTNSAILNTLTQVGASGYFYATSYTAVRGGDYSIAGFVTLDPNGNQAAVNVNPFLAASLPGVSAVDLFVTSTATMTTSLTDQDAISSAAVGNAIGLATTTSANGTVKHRTTTIAITPIRII